MSDAEKSGDDPPSKAHRPNNSKTAGDIEYQCLACENVRYPPGGGYKGVRHRIYCPECRTMTNHERTDYQPVAERQAGDEQRRAEANGWRTNAEGNLVIGGADETEEGDE